MEVDVGFVVDLVEAFAVGVVFVVDSGDESISRTSFSFVREAFIFFVVFPFLDCAGFLLEACLLSVLPRAHR